MTLKCKVSEFDAFTRDYRIQDQRRLCTKLLLNMFFRWICQSLTDVIQMYTIKVAPNIKHLTYLYPSGCSWSFFLCYGKYLCLRPLYLPLPYPWISLLRSIPTFGATLWSISNSLIFVNINVHRISTLLWLQLKTNSLHKVQKKKKQSLQKIYTWPLFHVFYNMMFYFQFVKSAV